MVNVQSHELCSVANKHTKVFKRPIGTELKSCLITVCKLLYVLVVEHYILNRGEMKLEGDTYVIRYNSFLHFGLSGSPFP